ncbi:MAG: tryptophan synthase subunit alpha [bacterium]
MNERGLPLDLLLAARHEQGRKTLVPFLTAGYPDEQTFSALLGEAAAAGCPLVEIGIPFSDPVADGPVIQEASRQALAAGVTLKGVLAMAAAARRDHGLNVILMGYLNPILRFGGERFAAACGEAGVVGVIVPDLPREEAADLDAALAACGVALIDLVAPTTDADRLEVFGRESVGFLYLVSSTGVTGKRSGGDLAGYLHRVRAACPQPLFVGFGIDSPDVAREVCRHADGVIIGSALLRIISEAPDGQAVSRAGAFLRAVNAVMSPATRGERP